MARSAYNAGFRLLTRIPMQRAACSTGVRSAMSAGRAALGAHLRPPRHPRAPGRARARRSRWRRHSRRAASPPTVPAKTVVRTVPPRVDERAAGVARAHEPAQRREQSRHRPAAVGVVGEHVCVRPMRPGCASNGPVLRVAEDRAGAAGRRVRDSRRRAGRPRPGTLQHGDVVGRDRRRARRAGRLGERPRTCTVVSLLAGHHVRVGDDHDPGSATHPEPSIASPQAVPSTRTTLREAALTPGVRAIARRRRRDIRRAARRSTAAGPGARAR